MGQTPSSSNNVGGSNASAPAKTCYYELLCVDRAATPYEIRKAYHRKALELHPDRNYNDVERATRLFAEVQTAFEVLSDPQERAWYDSHRETILGGHHHHHGPGEAPAPVGITTSETVLSWFSELSSPISYSGHDPNGFYAILQKAFGKLAADEASAAARAGEDAVEYPLFGNNKDTYESGHVRDFYLAWSHFSTRKSFAWCDIYRYTDAPDRRVKRAMERDNMKAREAARREFNDTVISFVKFVRKRDPRFTPNMQTEAQRQAALLQKSREQAARHRAENAKKRGEYRAADWTRVEPEDEDEVEDEGEDEDEDEEEEEEEEERYECVVCRKVFRSQGQMDAHEKSKKHVKAVQQLKRQMMKENKQFDLDRDVRGRTYKPEDEFVPLGDEGEGEDEDEDEVSAAKEEDLDDLLNGTVDKENEPTTATATTEDTEKPSPPPEQGPKEMNSDEYVSAEKLQARALDEGSDVDVLSSGLASAALSDDNHKDSKPAPKLRKAKAKRAKRAQKAAAVEEQAQASDFNCITCRQHFLSKTKLFDHLKENPAHAKLVPVNSGSGGGKKGRR